MALNLKPMCFNTRIISSLRGFYPYYLLTRLHSLFNRTPCSIAINGTTCSIKLRRYSIALRVQLYRLLWASARNLYRFPVQKALSWWPVSTAQLDSSHSTEFEYTAQRPSLLLSFRQLEASLHGIGHRSLESCQLFPRLWWDPVSARYRHSRYHH